MAHILKYKAPSREWVPSAQGWTSVRWTTSGTLTAVAAGAWFGDDSQHDFEPGVGGLAREAQFVYAILAGA